MRNRDPDDTDRALLKVQDLNAAALTATRENGVDEPDPTLARPSDVAITEDEQPVEANPWGALLADLPEAFDAWEKVARVLARCYVTLAVRRVVSREAAGQGLERLRQFSNRLDSLEWTLRRLSERG